MLQNDVDVAMAAKLLYFVQVFNLSGTHINNNKDIEKKPFSNLQIADVLIFQRHGPQRYPKIEMK